jgi:hypothetical protein
MFLVEVQEVMRRLTLPEIPQARDEVLEVLESTTVRMLALLETRGFDRGTFQDDFMVGESYRGIKGLFPLRLSRPFISGVPMSIKFAENYRDLSSGAEVDPRDVLVQQERGFVSLTDQPITQGKPYYIRVTYEAGFLTYEEELETDVTATIYDEVPGWLQDLAYMSAADLYHRRPEAVEREKGGFPLPDYYHTLMYQNSRASSFALRPIGV